MSENFSRKLVVEICNARNLMPKDGQGTSSAYVLVDFDGQRRRTKTKLRDLNPQWDEKLEFHVHDPESMASETLEINVYNDKKTGKRSTFLGKVKISGGSFAKSGSEALVYYPLEKRSVFSQIKGEIGLKIGYLDEPVPVSDTDPKPDTPPVADAADPKEGEEKKEEEKPPENLKQEETPSAPATVPEPTPAPAPDPDPAPPVKDEMPVENQQISAVDSAKQETEKPVTEKISPDSGVNESEIRSLADRTGRTYDLVEKMPYLFVRVLKAKRTATDADTDKESLTYAKIVIGSHSTRTRATQNTDWDQVFAFNKEGLNSTSLEVSVWVERRSKESDTVTETGLGTVSFDVQEVPKRVPPDSPLAPQWYTLEGSPENSSGNDVMLAVWVGTQVDEAFQESWLSDSGGLVPETRAKAYLSPKLWYLRLTVIQTQDLQLASGASEAKARSSPELYVKAQLGAQVFKTAKIVAGSGNPSWDEDLMFVAAEPFDPFLVICVEDVLRGQPVGQAKVQVSSIDRRTDNRTEPRSRWFNLTGFDDKGSYAGRIHVRVCLEGGYHVLDEAAHVTSDVRAASNQLSRPAIGCLEIGIREATNLLPMKTKDGTRGTADAYVVAKYGPKWVRTRTILDRFNPRWHEQYAWDVYDPSTVLTVAVFDNGRYKSDGRDIRIGKIRIRLSTLDTNRLYANTYQLILVHPSGAKKMGELELAVRFTCSSYMNLLQAYSMPMLPRMHYIRPLGPVQQDLLRHTAMKIVTARMARTEPPLGHEVVQYVLDSDTHVFSMRRSKANWFRAVGCLSRAASFVRWVDAVRSWSHPSTTVLVHMLLLTVVLAPHLILPTIFMYMFFIVTWRYRNRRRAPGGMDPRLSYVDAVGPDEIDEEFDSFPTVRSSDQLRTRYDRLRALASRAQSLLGDVAAQGERVEALFNWRDPRATGIFVVFCLVCALVFYVVPIKAIVVGWGFYYLRHPRFRDDMPSVPVNFFRRLPSLSDRIL